MSRDKIPSLDGVRGVAILVVLVHNAAYVLHGSELFALKLVSAVTATGWAGVQLFFVLSGFLITGILVGARGTRHRYRTFYIRRTLRIFPLYYGSLAIILLAGPLLLDLPSWEARVAEDQWWYWTYLSNWGSPFGNGIPGLSHFWSLAVEEQFYLLWPLLVFNLSNRSLVRLCGVVVLATPFLRLSLRLAGLPEGTAYEFTVSRWDALAMGALLAILLRSDAGRDWLRRWVPRIGAATVTALAVFLALERGFHAGDLEVQVLGQTLTALLSAWLIHIGVEPVGRVARGLRDLLAADWLRTFGKYSYALYVIHFPVHRVGVHYLGDLVNGPDDGWRLLRLGGYVALVVGVSMALALLSWRFLERPFLSLKDRLAPRRTPVLPQAATG